LKNKVFEIDKVYPEKLLIKIIEELKKDKIIIMPSDTIYGFLSLPSQEKKLRKIKKRDKKSFLFLISNFNQLNKLNVNIEKNEHILKKYWPGPITFILKQNDDNTIGIRMPDWDILHRIINKIGYPLISTSVNYSGLPSFNEKDIIIKEFLNKVDLIIIDKNFKQNISSTIVDLSNKPYKILRKGKINFENIY
jgi:L-threonylcarbamoyladenylate synthase